MGLAAFTIREAAGTSTEATGMSSPIFETMPANSTFLTPEALAPIQGNCVETSGRLLIRTA